MLIMSAMPALIYFCVVGRKYVIGIILVNLWILILIDILHNMYTEEKETNNLCRPASFQILGMGTI